MTTITIHNVEKNKIEIREFTEAELEQLEKDKAESAARLAKEAAAKAAKAALLEKLGITEEEAKLLLS